MEPMVARNFADTYLYSIGGYERNLVDFLIKADQIDKSQEEFQDIVVDVKKRQVTNSLYNTLLSPAVVLLVGNVALPKAFKVFAAKDIKGQNKNVLKIYIDCTDLIKFKNGSFLCEKIDTLIAYLVSAMQHLIYYTDPKRLLNNTQMSMSGTEAFADCFNYVLGFLKLGSHGPNKERYMYMAAQYYQLTLLGKVPSDTVRNISKRISGIQDKDAKVIDMIVDNSDEGYKNIYTLLELMRDISKVDGLTVEAFIDKWSMLFGSGTHFATELYTSFSSMLTNAYCGVYINNQKTIESQVGRNLVEYTSALFRVGSEAL